MRYSCKRCGVEHEGLPDFAFDAPLPWYDVPESERADRVFLSSDLCVIDREHHFVRAVLMLPIRNTTEEFGFGVWASLSKKNFDRYVELFDADPPPDEAPYFAWLCNRLPGYPDTFALKTNLHLVPGGKRPRLELEPTEHPLAVDQRDGIELDALVQRLGDHLHG